jgi:hypothetical protein
MRRECHRLLIGRVVRRGLRWRRTGPGRTPAARPPAARSSRSAVGVGYRERTGGLPARRPGAGPACGPPARRRSRPGAPLRARVSLRHRHPGPPFEAGTPAEPVRPAGRLHCGSLVPGEGGQHAPGDDCVHYQYFQRFANFFGPAQLCDGEIKIGVWIRFVFQCVMPPLAVVPIKTAGLHERTKVLTASRLDWRDSFCSMM